MMTRKNALKYRQFVYRPTDDDPLLSASDAELLAYSTLPRSKERASITRIHLIEPGKYVPEETAMHRMWLHDILDDYGIKYFVEVMGVFVGRRKFRSMQGIYVLDSDLEGALEIMEKYKTAPRATSKEIEMEENFTEETQFFVDGILQSKCSDCGREYDFDYPNCPFCRKKREMEENIRVGAALAGKGTAGVVGTVGVASVHNKKEASGGKGAKVKKMTTKHISVLQEYIFGDATIPNEIEASSSGSEILHDVCAVFLSLCDKKSRTKVVKGVGYTMSDAWLSAKQEAYAVIDSGFNVVWAKADIVSSAKSIPTADLNKALIKAYYRYFFRQGIAFDDEFDVAFLEGEINGNKLINYYTEQEISNRSFDHYGVVLDRDRINKYQKGRGGSEVAAIPEKVITFTTTAFFCDENLSIHELFEKSPDCGRRMVEPVDVKAVAPLISSAYKYLAEMIKPSGEFVYGVYPIYHKEIENYNILRHAGSVWSLVKLYSTQRDAAVAEKIKSAVEYLEKEFVTYRDDTTAFVVEKKSSELKLGGNALAVIMLTEYMEVFKTDKYLGLVKALTNGILEMQNRRSGEFFHVWRYPDFEPVDAFRTVYYDGEAAFALVRAYECTGYAKYLDAAKLAVENFIDLDYTSHRDHWVSYALNEITRHVPDVRYFEFAMKNAANNTKRIMELTRSAQTSFELLTVAWETLMRIKEQGVTSRYLKKFDTAEFARVIYLRAQHLLNGFFFPEVAMYMKFPDKVVGTFFTREDNFKVRIDEIQHYILGYSIYCMHYDEIAEYLG